MSTGLILFIGALVVAYVAFMVYSSNQPKSKEKSKPKQAGRNALYDMEPVEKSKPKKTQNVLKFHNEKSATGMLKKVTDDESAGVNEATLITRGGPKREDFLGSVDIIDGHQSHLDNHSDTIILKQWVFVGSPNESDLFQQEVQLILTELKRDGWTYEPAPDVKNRWFLSR